MVLNKKVKDITLNDIANSKIYDRVDFDKKRTPKEILECLDKGNQLLKETFVKKEFDRVKKQYNKIDPEFNLIITDYFKKEINTLTIVASRTVEPGPEDIEEKKNNWLFKGYITFIELKELPRIYPLFKKTYEEYSSPNWKLELDVLGGICQGQILIDNDSIEDWRKKEVLIEPWGFDENGNIICATDLLIETHKQLKEKVKEIQKKNEPKNLQKARLLKIDEEGDKLFNQIFYQ